MPVQLRRKQDASKYRAGDESDDDYENVRDKSCLKKSKVSNLTANSFLHLFVFIFMCMQI